VQQLLKEAQSDYKAIKNAIRALANAESVVADFVLSLGSPQYAAHFGQPDDVFGTTLERVLNGIFYYLGSHLAHVARPYVDGAISSVLGELQAIQKGQPQPGVVLLERVAGIMLAAVRQNAVAPSPPPGTPPPPRPSPPPHPAPPRTALPRPPNRRRLPPPPKTVG
jgi:hypothetical protein